MSERVEKETYKLYLGKVFKVFTVFNSGVECGVHPHLIKDVEIGTGATAIKLTVVAVGEKGRGRWEARIPIIGLRTTTKNVWGEETEVWDSPRLVKLLNTRKGHPKFEAIYSTSTNEVETTAIIVIMAVDGGYRGSVKYHGEEVSLKWPELVRLATGRSAQGAAGRMGSWPHPISIMPIDTGFGYTRGGRLYGKEPTFYFNYLPEKQLIRLTESERALVDLF